MSRSITSWLIGVTLFVSSTASAETVYDRAMQKLQAVPSTNITHFDFAVVGDTRSTQPIVLPDDFHQMIREWNLLKPALVLDDGDLILGGAAEGVGPQWDEFERVTGQSEVPFIPVVGNHDVSDLATQDIYLDRIGPLNFTLRYGNALIIALNTEEIGQVDTFSESQLTWLKAELAKSDADHIFLVMHKPYFASADRDRTWGPVEEMIKGYPVRAVFGSHWHYYKDCGEINGVRYAVTGGGGAERHYPEDQGGFPHYLWVSVRGEEVSWSVIRPGSVMPPDVVTDARLQEIQMLHKAIASDPIESPYGEGLDRNVSIKIANPYDAPLQSTIHWETPEGWHVEPASLPIAAPAKASTEVSVHVWADGPHAVRFPVPTLSAVVNNAEHGGPITVRTPIDLIPLTNSVRTKTPKVIDGASDDWQGVEALPLSYGWDFDVQDTDDLRSQIRLSWDKDYLYLLVETEDDEFHQPYAGDIVWSADNVQLFLDKWEWGLTLTEKGEEVFLYKGPDREGETVNTAVKLAVRRDGRRIVYEAAFPASEVAPLNLQPGSSYRFSAVMNDLDPSVPDRPRHWAELTPGAGDGHAWPRTKVVLAP